MRFCKDRKHWVREPTIKKSEYMVCMHPLNTEYNLVTGNPKTIYSPGFLRTHKEFCDRDAY
jgi:hypothetical protein